LVLDDGKGVGEVYKRNVTNTFRYKFAVVSAQDDVERLWQKNYDEAVLGYLSQGGESKTR
jgi:hypothetical protein